MTVDKLVLFRTIFEQSPLSTQIFAPTGEVVLVNHAWQELWKTSFSDIKGYNILKDASLQKKGTLPLIKKAFSGEVVHLPIDERAVRSKKGNTEPDCYWLEPTLYPIFDSQRKLVFVVLQHRDVTEESKAEIIKHRLASIVENSGDAIVGKTLAGIITSWNQAAERLFGYSATEAIGKPITIIIPPEFIGEEKAIIKRLKQGEPTEHLETTRLRKDGTQVEVSVTISPIKDHRGVIVGASKIARDITERKRDQLALKESEERLRLALAAGNIGVWDWNLVTGELTWTDRVYSIHNVEKNSFSLTLDTFRQLIHPDDRALVQESINQSLKENKVFSAEFRIITPEKKVKWVTTKAAVTVDSKGKAQRMLGATSDITQQKKMDQEKNDFLSLAAHELKTPLTSMKIFIELLKKEMASVEIERAKYFVKRIADQSERLSELTTDLLDISRIETGKLNFRYQSFNLAELVQETVESFKLLSPEHTFTLHCQTPVKIVGDRYRIYQVLVNLLTNAIKYSAEKREIIIICSKDTKHASVSVQDFGIGIQADHQELIFQRLYQITDTDERTYPGLGLGLFISKEIIERHQGEIKVVSQKGNGSTFSFTLPLHPMKVKT